MNGGNVSHPSSSPYGESFAVDDQRSFCCGQPIAGQGEIRPLASLAEVGFHFIGSCVAQTAYGGVNFSVRHPLDSCQH